jgi:hypothetical protein
MPRNHGNWPYALMKALNIALTAVVTGAAYLRCRNTVKSSPDFSCLSCGLYIVS